MKIGDLVRYKGGWWKNYLGVIIRQIPGTDEVQVIRWQDGEHGSYPKRKLEIINEGR